MVYRNSGDINVLEDSVLEESIKAGKAADGL